jgi:hypothetical protein
LTSDGCEKKPAPKKPDTAIEEYDQSVSLAFQALVFWEAGQTNRYTVVIEDPGFDVQLRKGLPLLKKQGKETEIPKCLNTYIDLWLVMFSGSASNHDWPDPKQNPALFDFLCKIAEYRKNHVTGIIADDNASRIITGILDQVLLKSSAIRTTTNLPSSK